MILVYPAERMNMESANTLLKTLEEPVGDVRFVLASEADTPAAAHHPQPLPDPRHGLAREQPSPGLVGGCSDRSAGGGKSASARAHTGPGCGLAAGGWWTPRRRPGLGRAAGLNAQAWSGLPKALARGDWSVLADWPAAQQLAVLQKLCHDLMASACGAPPRFFPAEACPPRRAGRRWPRGRAS